MLQSDLSVWIDEALTPHCIGAETSSLHLTSENRLFNENVFWKINMNLVTNPMLGITTTQKIAVQHICSINSVLPKLKTSINFTSIAPYIIDISPIYIYPIYVIGYEKVRFQKHSLRQ